MSNEQKTKIITHSNSFHADEVLAISFLKKFYFKSDDFEIIRTREPKLLEMYKNDPNLFVIDVGFEYNPLKLNFDHHQKESKKCWDNGILFSSCGMIWEWLKNNNYLDSLGLDVIHKMENYVVQKADAHDNGQLGMPFAIQLSKMNRNDDSADGMKQYKQFLQAINVATNYLDNVIYKFNMNENVFENKKTYNQDYVIDNSLYDFEKINVLKTYPELLNNPVIYLKNKDFNPNDFVTLSLIKQYMYPKQKVKIAFLSDLEILDKSCFVVGGDTYSPENLVFGEISDKKKTWDDGTIYSSTGLFWNWIKVNNVLTQFMNPETIHLMEEKLIKIVDGYTHGQNDSYELDVLSLNSRDFKSTKESFYKALKSIEFSDIFLKNIFAEIRSDLNANKEIKKAFKSSDNYSKETKVLILNNNTSDSYMSKAYEFSNGELNYLVVPHSKNKWSIKTAPQSLQDKFSQKNPFPEEYRGKSNLSVEINGKKFNLLFVHKSGFMAILNGTKQDVIDFTTSLLNQKKTISLLNENPSNDGKIIVKKRKLSLSK